MGVPAGEICDLASLDAALSGPVDGPMVVRVGASVPHWLAEGVDRIRRADRPLKVTMADPREVGDVGAGREIGMVIAILDAGVRPGELDGVAARRVRRVSEVLARWDDGRVRTHRGETR